MRNFAAACRDALSAAAIVGLVMLAYVAMNGGFPRESAIASPANCAKSSARIRQASVDVIGEMIAKGR